MNISRKLLMAGAAVSALTAIASQANAQASATTSATASVTIISPISITKTADLNFGRVVLNSQASGGTIAVSTAGAQTLSANLTSVAGAGSTATNAAFHVGGQSGQVYSVTLPASASITSGANSMTVGTFTSASTSGNTTLGASGDDVQVGATLTVGTGQAAGTYTGTFNVSVAYN